MSHPEPRISICWPFSTAQRAVGFNSGDQSARGGTPFIDLKGMHTTRRQRLHLISTPI